MKKKKKKTVKILNTNIFHKKAKKKKKTKKTFTWNMLITSTDSQGHTVFATQVHTDHFQPKIYLFLMTCTTIFMFYKSNFSRCESWRIAMYTVRFGLFPCLSRSQNHFHHDTFWLSSLNLTWKVSAWCRTRYILTSRKYSRNIRNICPL